MPKTDRNDAHERHRRVQPETGLSVQISSDRSQQIRMGTTSRQRGLRRCRRAETFARILSAVARRDQSLAAPRRYLAMSRKNTDRYYCLIT